MCCLRDPNGCQLLETGWRVGKMIKRWWISVTEVGQWKLGGVGLEDIGDRIWEIPMSAHNETGSLRV